MTTDESIKVLEDHVADLRRSAEVLDAHPDFKATAAEFRKAADEVTAAIDALKKQEVVALTPIMLADALEVFWNASLGATHPHQDATANAVMGGMVEGFAAMATRLRELAAPPSTET